MNTLVNLRRARKARDRAAKAASSAENRARFGRTAAQRSADEAAAQRRAALLDGARLPSPGLPPTDAAPEPPLVGDVAKRPGLGMVAPLAVLLASCAAEPPPPATTSTAVPVVRYAPPTRFDGRYVGLPVLNADRTRACPKPPAQERLLTVTAGRGALELDPAARQVLSGTVGEDGSLRLSDRVDRTIATEGIFTPDGFFLGEHRNGLCSYTMRLRKRD